MKLYLKERNVSATLSPQVKEVRVIRGSPISTKGTRRKEQQLFFLI